METEKVKILFRATVRNYCEIYVPQIEYKEFTVISETRCGYWINEHGNYGPKKFVLKTEYGSGKRFAYVTKELALDNLLRRRKRYARILRTQTSRNIAVLALLDEMQTKADEVCQECEVTKTDLFECQRCGKLMCENCQAPFNQFSQIDYNCCTSCYENQD